MVLLCCDGSISLPAGFVVFHMLLCSVHVFLLIFAIHLFVISLIIIKNIPLKEYSNII